MQISYARVSGENLFGNLGHPCPAGFAKKSVMGAEQSQFALSNKGNYHDALMVRKSE